MQTFHGTLQTSTTGESPVTVGLQFDGHRIRMWSDRRRIGSWDADEVTFKRESIFRFLVVIADEEYRFSPDDPSGFADSVEMEIDLTTEERPRFGLADRIRRVQAG